MIVNDFSPAVGYCQCGCGEWLGFWKGTDRRLGRVKGEPKRFVRGHQGRTATTLTAAEYKRYWLAEYPDIPYGTCQCGCGQATSVSRQTGRAAPCVLGEPKRFVYGHQSRTPPRAAEIAINDEIARIPLTQSRFAIVDAEDAEWLSQWNWYYWDGYARRNGPWANKDGSRSRNPILMHRAILSAPPLLEVDHANGETLNNRKINLRLATRAQNQQNRQATNGCGLSKFKGVHWHTRILRWAATIGGNGARNHLGYFNTEEEAASAYDEAATLRYGEFARLNFPRAVADAGGIALAYERLTGERL